MVVPRIIMLAAAYSSIFDAPKPFGFYYIEDIQMRPGVSAGRDHIRLLRL